MEVAIVNKLSYSSQREDYSNRRYAPYVLYQLQRILLRFFVDFWRN